MLSGMHALERLFGNDFAPVRGARRLGIAAVDRIPGLKRAFARQAMGMGPGVTGLLAGQKLLGQVGGLKLVRILGPLRRTSPIHSGLRSDVTAYCRCSLFAAQFAHPSAQALPHSLHLVHVQT